MTLEFILNGEDVETKSAPQTILVDILRDSFGLLGTKASCYTGVCSSCSIIFNGNMVKSCLIPAFKANGCEIITIEGFALTDEYQDIVTGFSETGLENCGFCNTAKILATQALLSRNPRPSRSQILSAFYGIRCRCTDPEGLIEGVLAVMECRRLRLYGPQ